MLVFGWTAAVVFVVAVLVRPWKLPRNIVLLPLAFSLLAAAWTLATGAIAYADMMKQGAWTGASIAIGFVPAKAIVFALLAYAFGRAILTAKNTSTSGWKAWTTPTVLGVICIYLGASDVLMFRTAGLERHARDTTLSPEKLSILSERVRNGAAGQDEARYFLSNPLCPPDLLHRFAESNESLNRSAVARNPNLSLELADKLSQDQDEYVRLYAAGNPALSVAALSRLSRDVSEMVRQTAAWKKDLPDEDFERLVEDPSSKVRATVALQRRLSDDGIKRLMIDPDKEVRDAVRRFRNLEEEP